VKTSRTLLTLIVATSVALTACSTAATPTLQPTAAPSAGPGGPTPVTDGTLPEPELKSFKLGTPIGEVSQFNGILADMLGLYDKYGIDVEVFRFNAGGDASQALIAGATDGAAGSGSVIMLTSQLAGSDQVVAVSVFKSKVFDGIFCAAHIKTADQMKGASVAISTLGTTAHASVNLALEALGMSQKDVNIIQVGGQSVRLAAMKGGSVECAPVSIDLQADMEELGFNLIIDLSQSDLGYPSTGLAVMAPFLQQYPKTVEVIAAAQLEAQNLMVQDPDLAAEKWAEFAQIDLAKAKEQVLAAGPQLRLSMTCTLQGFEFAQKTLAIIQPSAMMADATKACDGSILQDLMDIGFYDKVGAPKTP